MSNSLTMTVELTPAILRAILSTMEGGTACGCHTAPAPAQPYTSVPYDFDDQMRAAGAERLPDMPGTDGDYTDEQMAAEVNASIGAAAAFVPPVPMPPTTNVQFAAPPSGPLNPPGAPAVNLTPPVATTGFITTTPPMPPVTAASAPPAGVALDGEGLPWDRRIHASTKTFRQSDNTWKLLKGIDKDVVEKVKAELRATMGVPAVTPHLSGTWTPETGHVIGIPTPPVVQQVAPPVVHNYSGAQSGGYEPPPGGWVAPTPIVTAPPEPPTASPTVTVVTATGASVDLTGAMTFPEFVTWATSKMAAKELTRAQLEQACADQGITSLPMLQNRPDLVPVIHKFLESICIPFTSGGE